MMPCGDAMIRDVQRRRDAVKDTAGGRARRRNPSIVCMDIERNDRGQFVRHRR